MAKIRIAVAGAGLMGRRHIEEIRKNPTAQLASIVDPSPQAAEVAKTETVRLYPSLRDMIVADRPDGVILATPNRLHVEQALECVAWNLPVLVEKPIAHTVEEGERLVDAAERVKAKLIVGHHRSHSTILLKTAEIVKSSILGRIVGVIGSAAFYKPENEGYFDGANAWRRESGGGPILINLIHEVGNLRMMIGEIVSVQAFASNATRGFQVEDTVAIAFRFANGALGTFFLSDTAASAKSWEQTSTENKAFAAYPDEDAYTILGTSGSLGVPTMTMKYYESENARSWSKPFSTKIFPFERCDPLTRQLEHFIAVIRGEVQPLVTGRDALQNLRVTEAVARAARTGSIIHITNA